MHIPGFVSMDRHLRDALSHDRSLAWLKLRLRLDIAGRNVISILTSDVDILGSVLRQRL
jgi:hypothetical protein